LPPRVTGRGGNQLPDYVASRTVKGYARFYPCEDIKSRRLFSFFFPNPGAESARYSHLPLADGQ